MRPASTPATRGSKSSKFQKLERYRKSYRYTDGEWAASYDGDVAPFIYPSLRQNEEHAPCWKNEEEESDYEPAWQREEGWEKEKEKEAKPVEVLSPRRQEFERRLKLGEQCLRLHSSRRGAGGFAADAESVPVTMYGRGMSTKTEKLYDSLLVPKKEKARRALGKFVGLETRQKNRLLNMMTMDPEPEDEYDKETKPKQPFGRLNASAMAYYKMKREKREEADLEKSWMSKGSRRASIAFMRLGKDGKRRPHHKQLTPSEIDAEEQAAEIDALTATHQEKRVEFYDEFRQVNESKLRGNRGNGDTASYEDFDNDDSKYTTFIEDLDDQQLPPEPLPLRLQNNSAKQSTPNDNSESSEDDERGERRRTLGMGLGLAHFGIGDERGKALSKAMENLTTLKEIDLSDNRLHDGAVCKLLLSMRNNHSLRRLNLSSNTVGGDSFTMLMPLLWDPTVHLTELCLHNCKVSEPQIQQMLSGLSGKDGEQHQMKLTTLDLSRNQIGAAGAEMISLLLQKRTCNITDLNLSWNSIQGHGVEALGEALSRKYCQLRKLDMSFNQSGRSMMHIAEALRENGSLEELDISRNHFKGESTLGELAAPSGAGVRNRCLY
jgi:hypothetical protein